MGGVVMAGAEGVLRVDEQADSARRHRAWVVTAAQEETPGVDGRQRRLAFRHPIDVRQGFDVKIYPGQPGQVLPHGDQCCHGFGLRLLA